MKLRLLTVLICTLTYATTADAIRCNSRLAIKGDSSHKFRAVCGEPAHIERRVIYLTNRFISGNQQQQRHSNLHQQNQFPTVRGQMSAIELERAEQVIIEEWHYNFGPRRLMQIVTFRNGIATDIEVDGYGY